MNHFFILGTIIFTVYGQLILKWRIGRYGDLPDSLSDRIQFLFRLLLDGYILSGFIAAFIASLFWMAAMTKFQLSYAYPFMSLAFVLVMFLSAFFFNEPVTLAKTLGLTLIVAGIIIGSQGVTSDKTDTPSSSLSAKD
ncbi:putative 4-amino-4-deoxy-L-arabinose-phosphoundecaprenol flippase subunit ArnF [Gimesia chilikensis]|uniref:Putative 4-amino-4-deoxy-L-arabinose-phosphoundecaprenol flippase subunit ArnF n=1 Tax=Gimesia chilikensis TaxID=2605989 RepID=A0A517WKR0_9PLAN|nr:EamA family transporter [Gimesia chilikensis]QDU05840.1 putative 4-amino-4-deoxy-L-arabinose-phosphoundecaprenol flippase subunit ArnF [Gimesia chilikensis]